MSSCSAVWAWRSSQASPGSWYVRAVRAERDRLAAEVERLRVDNQRLQVRVGELAA